MHGVRGSPQYRRGYGRCGGRWTDLSVAPHLQGKHIGYVLIDLTSRNWYLHLHALHTCWCDVVVALWHPCARVCVCLCGPLVGAMLVVESPVSCREGAGSILAALMAPLPKRKRRSCCEQLTEQVPERTAAGGGGGDFVPVSLLSHSSFSTAGFMAQAHVELYCEA